MIDKDIDGLSNYISFLKEENACLKAELARYKSMIQLFHVATDTSDAEPLKRCHECASWQIGTDAEGKPVFPCIHNRDSTSQWRELGL